MDNISRTVLRNATTASFLKMKTEFMGAELFEDHCVTDLSSRPGKEALCERTTITKETSRPPAVPKSW